MTESKVVWTLAKLKELSLDDLFKLKWEDVFTAQLLGECLSLYPDRYWNNNSLLKGPTHPQRLDLNTYEAAAADQLNLLKFCIFHGGRGDKASFSCVAGTASLATLKVYKNVCDEVDLDTALWRAVFGCKDETVQQLIAWGAKDFDGAVTAACSIHDIKRVDYFIKEHKAKVSGEAVQRACCPEIIKDPKPFLKLLKERGATDFSYPIKHGGSLREFALKELL